MNTYLAFLRGVNVGGKSLIKMEQLKEALLAHGLLEVRTYIQSGNIIFGSDSSSEDELAKIVATCIKNVFSLDVAVVVFSQQRWQRIIANAPDWWGRESDWKHNIFIMIKPYDMSKVMSLIGELRPGMEACEAGDGVVYQSIALRAVGRGATGSKIASRPIYKQMSIRSYNTATRVAVLLG